MKKDVYYFSHDCNAHQDVKHKAMMSVYGAEGYGWYWILIELMRQEEGYKISISRKFDIPSLSTSLPNCSTDRCKEFIQDCVKEFELFESDENFIWSTSLLERMKKVDSNKKNNRKAGYARWGKDENGVPLKDKESKQPFDEQEINVDKQEKKEPEDPAKIKGIQVLNDDKLFNMFVEQLKENDDFKNLHDKHFQNERSKCLDWLSANGKAKKDYKAFFRSWLRNNFNAPTEQVSTIPAKKGQKPMVI